MFLEIVLNYSFKILDTLNHFGFLALAIQLYVCYFFFACFPLLTVFFCLSPFLMYLISTILDISYLYSIPFIKFSFESIFPSESCNLVLISEIILLILIILFHWFDELSFLFFLLFLFLPFEFLIQGDFSYFQRLAHLYVIKSAVFSCKLFLLYDYFLRENLHRLNWVDSSFLIHIIIFNRFLFPMDFFKDLIIFRFLIQCCPLLPILKSISLVECVCVCICEREKENGREGERWGIWSMSFIFC